MSEVSSFLLSSVVFREPSSFPEKSQLATFLPATNRNVFFSESLQALGVILFRFCQLIRWKWGCCCCLSLHFLEGRECFFCFHLFVYGCAGSSLQGAAACEPLSSQRAGSGALPLQQWRTWARCGAWASESRLSGGGAGSSLVPSLWDLPRSGIWPVPPALAGCLFTTEPPGKLWGCASCILSFMDCLSDHWLVFQLDFNL